MDNPMMKCGHTANAYRVLPDGTRVHACVICSCTDIEKGKPNLVGRKARCTYFGQPVGRHNETYFPNLMTTNNYGKTCCGSMDDSNMELPFFMHRPEKEYDEFYCGCSGWD